MHPILKRAHTKGRARARRRRRWSLRAGRAGRQGCQPDARLRAAPGKLERGDRRGLQIQKINRSKRDDRHGRPSVCRKSNYFIGNLSLCHSERQRRISGRTFEKAPEFSASITLLAPRFFGRCPQNDSPIGFIVMIALIVFLQSDAAAFAAAFFAL